MPRMLNLMRMAAVAVGRPGGAAGCSERWTASPTRSTAGRISLTCCWQCFHRAKGDRRMKGLEKPGVWPLVLAVGLVMALAQAAGAQPATAATASAQATDPVSVVDAFHA